MYLPVEGQFLTIIVQDGKQKGTYQSSLYDINAHHLYVSRPQMEGNPSAIQLASGTVVSLDYRDAKDIPCRFETIVDDFPGADQNNMMALKCPQLIERHQHRENIRVPVSWPVTLIHPSATVSAKMNDLSGGGLSAWISSELPMQSGDSVIVKFDILTGKQSMPVHTEAVVVIAQDMEADEGNYLCSLKFTSLEESTRHKIIEFVFYRQNLDIALRNVKVVF